MSFSMLLFGSADRVAALGGNAAMWEGDYSNISVFPHTMSNQNVAWTNGSNFTAIWDEVLESDYSNEASATPQQYEALAPEDLTAVAGDAQVTLSWTASDPGNDGGGGAGCPECPDGSGEFIDCAGTCFNDSDCTGGCLNWRADGYCYDGTWGIVFWIAGGGCPEWGNDCGDCEALDDPYGVCDGDCAGGGGGGGGGGTETCDDCEQDFTAYGSECCDTAWDEYGLTCAELEANYNWDCAGCNCPGDGDAVCGDGFCTGDEDYYNCPEDCLAPGECEDGYITDCADDDCCPESWIGDGFPDCEDQQYGCDLTC